METPKDFAGVVDFILGFINILIPLIFGVVFLFLIVKVIDAWIIHADDESKRAEGRRTMITAVIVFVVMLSAWGIVAMIRSSIFG